MHLCLLNKENIKTTLICSNEGEEKKMNDKKKRSMDEIKIIISITKEEVTPDPRMKEALRGEDEYFQPNEHSGKVLIREACNILDNIAKEWCSQCDHKDDEKQLTNEQIRQQDINPQLLNKYETHRSQYYKPYYKSNMKEISGQKYFCSLVVMPSCFKQFINYKISNTKYYLRKKDSEGKVALSIIEDLYKMRKIDDHFYYISDKKSAKEETSDQKSKDNTVVVNDKNYLIRPWKVSDKLRILVFKGKDSSNDYPIKATRHLLGVCIQNSLRHLNIQFRLLVDQKTLMRNSEIFGNNRIDQNSDGYLDMITEEIEINDFPYSSIEELIQKLKFYHVWSFFYLQNAESQFLKQIFKGGFTFAESIFGELLKKINRPMYQKLLSLFMRKLDEIHFNKTDLLECNTLIVPIIREQEILKVNYQLIESLITNVKLHIMNLIAAFSEKISQPNANIEQEIIVSRSNSNQVWNMNDQKYIINSLESLNDFWDYYYSSSQFIKPLPSRSNVQSSIQQFSKFDKLPLYQFFPLNYGMFVDNNQGQLIAKCTRLNPYLEGIPAKPKPEDSKADQTVILPEQLMTRSPLNYEQQQVLSLSAHHMMRLFDYFKIEEFIKEYFDQNEVHFISQDCNYLKQSVLYNPTKHEEILDLIYQNSNVLIEAFTAPTTQYKQNYERLEIYGDSAISVLVIIELFAMRLNEQNEKVLDSLRIMKTNNNKFIEINLEKQICKYMLTEPYNYSKHFIPPEFENHTNVLSQKKENEAKQKQFLVDYQQLIVTEQIKKLQEEDYGNASMKQYLQALKLILSKPNLKKLFKENHKHAYDFYRNYLAQRDKQQDNDNNFELHRIAAEFQVQFKVSYKHLQLIVIESLKRPTNSQTALTQKTIEESKTNSPSKQQPKQQAQKQDSRKQTIQLKITKDKKLADVIESVAGAITQIAGLSTAHQFLRKIGVLQQDQQTVFQKLQKISQYQKETNQFKADETYQKLNLYKVEETLQYEFKNKYLLIQALTHKSYGDVVKIDDYNILEFLGDSLLNYFIVQYFVQHSQNYKEDYPPQQLHKLKSSVVNNVFLSLIVIENDVHKMILKQQKPQFDGQFNQFVSDVKTILGEFSTQKQYEFMQQKYGTDWEYVKENFMKKEIVDEFAKINDNKIFMDELYESNLKIFGDILEALIGAVFVDSQSMETTRQVLINLFEPYIMVFANLNLLQDHPRTQLNELWNSQPYTKGMKIIHAMQTQNFVKPFIREQKDMNDESSLGKIRYKGYIDNFEVLSEEFSNQEKNKLRKFYTSFLKEIQQLIKNFGDWNNQNKAGNSIKLSLAQQSKIFTEYLKSNPASGSTPHQQY